MAFSEMRFRDTAGAAATCGKACAPAMRTPWRASSIFSLACLRSMSPARTFPISWSSTGSWNEVHQLERSAAPVVGVSALVST